MFKEYSTLGIVVFVLSSLHVEKADAHCPLCGFQAAYWIRNELAELNCGSCGSLSDYDTLLDDVDFLLNQSASMLKNGKLYFRGAVGDTGVMGGFGQQGSIGFTGVTGSTGASGLIGNTGTTGATGATGMRGVQGPPGSTRVKRETNSNKTGKARNKIAPFLVNCSEVDAYFLSFAGEIDDKRAGKVNRTKKVESQNVKKLIARYQQVSLLYEHVRTLVDNVQKVVGADPRYKGATGSKGIMGYNGRSGATGIPGSQGRTGFTGPTGSSGLPGANGFTGNTGPIGL